MPRFHVLFSFSLHKSKETFLIISVYIRLPHGDVQKKIRKEEQNLELIQERVQAKLGKLIRSDFVVSTFATKNIFHSQDLFIISDICVEQNRFGTKKRWNTVASQHLSIFFPPSKVYCLQQLSFLSQLVLLFSHYMLLKHLFMKRQKGRVSCVPDLL